MAMNFFELRLNGALYILLPDLFHINLHNEMIIVQDIDGNVIFNRYDCQKVEVLMGVTNQIFLVNCELTLTFQKFEVKSQSFYTVEVYKTQV